jgi:hypothetical protein
MTKDERKAVKECKAQIAIDLVFLKDDRKVAQDALDKINNRVQNIETRLINLEKYLA